MLMWTVPNLGKTQENLNVNVHKGIQMTSTSVTFTLLLKAVLVLWKQTGIGEMELAAAFSTRTETLYF